jgi:hypothetical protein
VRDALEQVANGDVDPDPALDGAAAALIGVYDAVAACTDERYAPR